MRSGTKSLVEGLKFLEALHGKILNVPDANHQQIEVFSAVCLFGQKNSPKNFSLAHICSGKGPPISFFTS